MIRLRTSPWFAHTLALGCGANALVVDGDVPDDLLDAGSDARDAGGDVRDAPPEVDASIRTHLVTPSSDVVAFEPRAVVAVRSGQAASFTVTTSAAFEILVEGTCAAGTWTGGVYTTGPVTADCTVVFARGCDTCGGACVTYGTPDVWTSFGAFEVCANTCAITPRPAPACGTCDPKCGIGESCINGQCRCVAGPRRCTGMVAAPHCARPGCLFTEGSELDPVAPIRHHFVEVNARKNEPFWLHLQFDGMFAGTTYPYVMECVAGAGEFRFPSGSSQAANFEADGTITNMTELEPRTSVVRSCLPFEAAPPIYSPRALRVLLHAHLDRHGRRPRDASARAPRPELVVDGELDALLGHVPGQRGRRARPRARAGGWLDGIGVGCGRMQGRRVVSVVERSRWRR